MGGAGEKFMMLKLTRVNCLDYESQKDCNANVLELINPLHGFPCAECLLTRLDLGQVSPADRVYPWSGVACRWRMPLVKCEVKFPGHVMSDYMITEKLRTLPSFTPENNGIVKMKLCGIYHLLHISRYHIDNRCAGMLVLIARS